MVVSGDEDREGVAPMHPYRAKIVACATLLLVVVVAGVASAGGNPPGNNGTVKVNGVGIDGPGNDPHVGCAFQIEFAGFDAGDLTGTAGFELVPPSGRALLLEDSTAIGEDEAGGANDVDAILVEDLTGPIVASGATPHPVQGVHVRLTVAAEGSIGAMTKHKTFWVTCGGGEGGGEGGAG